MLRYTVRPISDHTWQNTSGHTTSQFTSTWTDTLDLLERELGALRAKELVLEVDVRERDIRNDGLLRSDAKASSPAVVVAFESKHGAMLYRCDRYTSVPYRNRMAPWQHNVRAIALTLQALRAVDRYGATETGQQYTGFKALPAGGIALGAGMTAADAAEFIEEHSGVSVRLPVSEPVLALAYRKAVRALHPDIGGDVELFQRLQKAKELLDGAA
jgi:hypothetical protein